MSRGVPVATGAARREGRSRLCMVLCKSAAGEVGVGIQRPEANSGEEDEGAHNLLAHFFP